MVFLQGNTSQNTTQTVAKNYHSIPTGNHWLPDY